MACLHDGSRVYDILQEKKTDVAIAVRMLEDAHADACDKLVLITGDSDWSRPLKPSLRSMGSRLFYTSHVGPEPRMLRFVAQMSLGSGDESIDASNCPVRTLSSAPVR
jgi:hypothetical protein